MQQCAAVKGVIYLEMLRKSCLGLGGALSEVSRQGMAQVGAAGNLRPSELLKIDCSLRMTPGRLLARSESEIMVGGVEG